MVNKKSKPLVTPEENIIRLGDLLYAIPGQFKKAEVIDITGGQVVIDPDPLVTISGDNIQELFYSTDYYITHLNQHAVLTFSDQTVTGTKTWLDSQVFGTNLVPQGATQAVGTLAQPFNEGHYTSLYADEIISSGSPGLRLTHGAGAGIIDTTENNDLNFRRFGSSFLKFLASGISLEQDVVMLGNLNVQGTTTSINTEELLVEDNLITLNHNYSGMPMLDSGLVINRGTEDPSLLLWDELLDRFVAGISGSEEPITMSSDLIAASGVLQADINTRATYVQLVAASGVLQSDIDSRVLRSGDTMTGSLTLNANPTSNLHASTKQYTDTADDLRVLKSGDTMTGTLVVPTVQGAGDLIIDAAGDDLFLRAQDDIFIQPNNAAATTWAFDSGGAFYPFTDATYDIGTTSRACNIVFSRNLLSDSVLGLGTSNTTRWVMTDSALYPNVDASYTLGTTSRACSAVYSRNILSDSTVLGIGAANAVQWNVNNGGTLYPSTNGTYDIGGTSNHVAVARINSVVSNANTMRVYNDAGTGGNLHLGMGISANFSVGAFLSLHGNTSGELGDARLGSGTGGRVLFYSGEHAGSNGLRWSIDNVGRLENVNAGADATYLNVYAFNFSQTQPIQLLRTNAASVNTYAFLTCQSEVSGAVDNKFHLLGNGNLRLDGSTNSPASDYAEYFEIKDGESAMSPGTTVVLDGDRVRAYDPGTDTAEDIVGVVRHKDTKTFTGNAPLNWPDRYQTTVFGEILTTSSGTPLENPEFDPEQEYIPREERPEWYKIGLIGQVQVLKSATKHPNWRKMKDLSDTVELWYIR